MNLGVVFAQILESLDQGLVFGLFCKGEIGLGSILWWCDVWYFIPVMWNSACVFLILYTRPETDNSPMKSRGCKTTSPFWEGPCSEAMLVLTSTFWVSFSEGPANHCKYIQRWYLESDLFERHDQQGYTNSFQVLWACSRFLHERHQSPMGCIDYDRFGMMWSNDSDKTGSPIARLIKIVFSWLVGVILYSRTGNPLLELMLTVWVFFPVIMYDRIPFLE